MIDQLKEQIKVVAELREVAEKLRNEKKDSLARWELNNGELLAYLSLNEEGVREEEAKLRELTLQAYAETGNKAPAPGVGIRERTVLTYDSLVAYEWAVEHKMALKLDTSAFEKIVKASPQQFASFSITITTEPQATIAQNLNEGG